MYFQQEKINAYEKISARIKTNEIEKRNGCVHACRTLWFENIFEKEKKNQKTTNPKKKKSEQNIFRQTSFFRLERAVPYAPTFPLRISTT